MTLRLQALIAAAAALLGACQGVEDYDLRGPALKPGQILQSTSRESLVGGTITIERAGETDTGTFDYQGFGVEELEVVEADTRGPRLLKQSVPENWQQFTAKAGAERNEVTADQPLAGTRVLLERGDSGFTRSLLDRQADARLARILAQPFELPGAEYPRHRVKLGESWTLEDAQLTRLLGSDYLSIRGSATFTLDRVADSGGERRAFLSYRLEATTKSLDDENQELESHLGGSGTIERSLDRGLDVNEHFSGQLRVVSHAVIERRKATITNAGTLKGEASERLVSASERHPTRLKGSPEPPQQAAIGPAPVPERRPMPRVAAEPAVMPANTSREVPAVRAATPPPRVDDSPRSYAFTGESAAIYRWPANGDAEAFLAGNRPPEPALHLSVNGEMVLRTASPVNEWNPVWGITTHFDARPGSRVRIWIVDNDIDGSTQTIASWEGTVADLVRQGGRLQFGAIERLSYRLETE
ncbi:MAG: hypothetical protein SF066_22985 [Thermoanaerobaculia bacterium]|nr:hypothetical protein [Thermoanaerobaculia bacterium]